jgi:GT2 family glycosyltransferase
LVAALLESFAAAREATPFEVEVLIVDSSEAEDANAIRQACERFHAQYLRHEANNVREKRNVGIRSSRFPTVLFVDSDCKAAPDLFVEHARGYENDHAGGVIGVTQFVGPSSRTWRFIERTSILDAFSYAARMETAPWGPTCNISYRREVLDQVGHFDEAFPFRLGSEDVDLGLRVTDSGHPIRSNPAAVVEHTRETWNSIPLIARRAFRWGRMHHHLMKKHPHRVQYDFPKTIGLFFVITIFALVTAAIHLRPLLLLVPLPWLALDLLLETVLVARSAESRPRDVGAYLGARMLGLTFEAGTLFESLLDGSLRPLYEEIYYAPPSPRSAGRSRKIAQIWAGILSLAAMLPLVTWLA